MLLSNLSYCNFEQKDLDSLKKLILSAEKIVLLPHSSADGDAMASCGAMKLFLDSQGKRSEVVCMDNPKTDIFTDFVVSRVNFVPDLIISMDTANKERSFFSDDFKNIPFVNIDHHSSNTFYADLNFVEPTASSACEVLACIIFKLFGENPFTDKEFSQLLLYGILDDSICFMTEQTSKDTLLVSSFLIASGADFKLAKDKVSRAMPVDKLKLWSEVIQCGEFVRNRMFILTIPLDYLRKRKVDGRAFGGFINMVSQTVTAGIVAVLVEYDTNMIKGSMRSRGVDVSKMAANFGGGGHKLAAGFNADNISIDQVKSELIQLL